MNNIAIHFTMRYAEVKQTGCSQEKAFNIVGQEFIKRTKAIKIEVSKGIILSHKFCFHDGSTCTFKDGYWKFNSQTINSQSKNNNHA